MTTLSAPRPLAGSSMQDRVLLALAHRLESYVTQRAHHDRSRVRIIAEIDHADRRDSARACGAMGLLPR